MAEQLLDPGRARAWPISATHRAALPDEHFVFSALGLGA